MREIKFRMWDKEIKEMLDNEELQQKDSDEWCVYNCITTENGNDGGIVFMQYTGLKDKNGKEIYEGDILSDHVFNYIVVFYAGAWCLKLSIASSSWYSLYPVACQREIVGNIYENPELLNFQQKS